MIKFHDSYVKKINNDFLIFNPCNQSNAIIENPANYSEENFWKIVSEELLDQLVENACTSSSSNTLYFGHALLLINKGCTITSPFYSAHCTNSKEKSFVFAPNGDIYKCITGLGNKHFLLSSFDQLENNPLIFYKNNIIQIESSHMAKCFNCEFLLMCNGGCKCQHFSNEDKLCRKSVFENEMDSFLNLLYYVSINEDGTCHERKK